MKSKISGVVETSPYFDLHEALTCKRKKGLLRTDSYNGRERLIRMDKQPAELNLDRFLLKGYDFEHVFISERLTPYRIGQFLNEGKAVFIDSQTGSGKTTMVFDSIYRQVVNDGTRLLYLCSRSALKQKSKIDAIKAAGTDHLKRFTDFGLQKEHTFGDIDVLTYQEIFGENPAVSAQNMDFLKKNAHNYGAVIFDECHFFAADAEFNPFTFEIMKNLIKLFAFQKVARFYLTGTAEVVFDSICFIEVAVQQQMDKEANAEKGICFSYPNILVSQPKSEILMRYFFFRRNYDYLNLYVIKKDKLVDKIRTSNNKWIIFVESKEHGGQLETELSESKTVFRLDSDILHDRTSEDGQKTEAFLTALTQREELAADVLITTKCLDVGVTIHTKNVNIACFLTDKTDFLQAIGRKRVSENESVNLFIPEYHASDVGKWIARTKRTLAEFDELAELYPEGCVVNSGSFRCPVYARNGVYRFNNLARVKLRARLNALNHLQAEIEASALPDTEVISSWFARWLEKEEAFCLDTSAISKDIQTDVSLSETIQSYIGETMDKDLFSEFCRKLKPFDTRKDQREDRAEISTRTVNAILQPLGFHILVEGAGEKSSYKIVKMEVSQ